MQASYDIVIIGAGAAGLMAATIAAEKQQKILCPKLKENIILTLLPNSIVRTK